MSELFNYDLCEIKEISPLYRLFNEYKNDELMLTVTFLILLMYLEEFLFAFRKEEKNSKQTLFLIFSMF
jgi:hypothetical protein